MRLPETDGHIDKERATQQIRYAIDHGVNYIDTAWSYHMGGESEPFLGRALADGYREKVRLATKMPSWLVTTRADMDRFLDAQLEKLQTDHIDYYLIHVLDSTAKLARLEACGMTAFLNEAKKSGKIVNTGFSFHGPAEDFAPPIVDATRGSSARYSTIFSTNRTRQAQKAQIRSRKRSRGHHHGTTPGRQPDRPGATRSRGHLGPITRSAHACGMGTPLDLEPPPRGDRCPFRHEQRGTYQRKYPDGT